MSTKTPIDLYTYPENATPLELARYMVSVMEASAEGQPVEYSCEQAPEWIALTWKGWDFLWLQGDARKYRYRIARPKIAEGHNPHGLSEDHVDIKNGWRLLTAEEITEERETTLEIQMLYESDKTWDSTGNCGSTHAYTYRTRKPKGYYLPKPKDEPKPRTLVPWTFSTSPVPPFSIRGIHGTEKIGTLIFKNATLAGFCFSEKIIDRTWLFISQTYEHSIDGGKTWLPCGTYEGGA